MSDSEIAKDEVNIIKYGIELHQIDPVKTNIFRRYEDSDKRQVLLRKHKAWMELIPHEQPLYYKKYKVGVYIRYFNQTKYDNYLDYHKQQFIDTITDYTYWELVDFYIDEGSSAPNMENANEWCRLLNDCLAGRIDLIITQKVSNVTRKPFEIEFIARILATQKNPVGIYFINEDIYTLASYFQIDMQEHGILPDNWTPLPDDSETTDCLEGGHDSAEELDE